MSDPYEEWDDASIGKAVKRIAGKICQEGGDLAVQRTAAMLVLVSIAIDENKTHTTHTAYGVTSSGFPVGDWQVSVSKTDPVWCSMCGEWGDHSSGNCSELS